MTKKKIVLIAVVSCVVIVLSYWLGWNSVHEQLCDVPYTNYTGYEVVIDGKEIDERIFSIDDLKDVRWYVEKNDKEAKILYITTKKK